MHVEKPMYMGVRIPSGGIHRKYLWMRDVRVDPITPFLADRYKLN